MKKKEIEKLDVRKGLNIFTKDNNSWKQGALGKMEAKINEIIEMLTNKPRGGGE